MTRVRVPRTGWSALLRLGAAAFAAAAIGTHCAASGSCFGDGECAAGTYCTVANVCHVDCMVDDDCMGGGTCDTARGRCLGGTQDSGTTDDDAVTGTDTGPVTDATATPELPGTDVVAPPDVPAGPDVPGVDVPLPVDVPVVDVPGADVPRVDVPPPMDVPVIVDVPVVVDHGTPVDLGPPDAGAPGGYLDPCTTDANCSTGQCLTTTSGARYCTRRCVSNDDCGAGFICNSPPAGTPAVCVPDDTGTACNPSTAAPCARYCLSNAEHLAARCTRECSAGADCPAGYACEDSSVPGVRVCIAVEQPCASRQDCTSDTCIMAPGGLGYCTSPCRSAADCPQRMTLDVGGRALVLPPYTCGIVGGMRVCIPPLQATTSGDGTIAGNHALGASCGASTTSNLCYSGVCDDMINTCMQGCTPSGGCPNGFNCLPWQPDGVGTAVYLACQRAVLGSVAVNGTCARAADCATGLCYPPATGSPYCTRYCPDRLCPTGMHCVPDGTTYDGTPLSLCQR